MISLSGASLTFNDLPSEILVEIFTYLSIQDSLGVGCVCRRFHYLVQWSGEIWKAVVIDVELTVETFQSIILRHAKHFRKLGLRFSQKRVRYNSPYMFIENSLACCENVKYLDLTYNTSIISLDFIYSMHPLKSLNVYGCTGIDPMNMIVCFKQCRSLRVLDISYCLQIKDEHISSLVQTLKDMPYLEKFKGESICPFSLGTVREILKNQNLKELAVTPTWGPPPAWAELLSQHTDIEFGEHLVSQWARIDLPNYLYESEEDDLDE